MDEEFTKQLADYFTGPELVDLLNIPVEELIGLLWDPYIEDNIKELKDVIN